LNQENKECSGQTITGFEPIKKSAVPFYLAAGDMSIIIPRCLAAGRSIGCPCIQSHEWFSFNSTFGIQLDNIKMDITI
jgi:hypothetical protein